MRVWKHIGDVMPVYDPKTRIVCLPLSTYDIEKHDACLTQLKQLGLTNISKIFVPVPLKTNFYCGKVPLFLALDISDEESNYLGIYTFCDSKNRSRFRVAFSSSLFVNTYVWTRYHPSTKFCYEAYPCVYDVEGDETEEGDIIWINKKVPKKSSLGETVTELSTQWLNKNYPDWRNPKAYWST